MKKASKRVGIVSYNMYGNFTNYGSALQTYALHKAINRISPDEVQSIVLDYCPDILADKDVLNPMKNMWDMNAEAQERCRLSLPAIRENYKKFKNFYSSQYQLSTKKYTSKNFNESLANEEIDGYVCGSDTIFSVPEFGFDDGFYANYQSMIGRSIAYAASFGDYDIDEKDIPELKKRLNNFKAIALREVDKKRLVENLFSAPVYKVIDPTLLLGREDYDTIAVEPCEVKPYLLLYSRRPNPEMDAFARKEAQKKKLNIVEISLSAHNGSEHSMRYDAGVEEFLGLVKNASMVVTNSFHGMIFAVIFRIPFFIFSRKLCDKKISELLNLFGIQNRKLITGQELTTSEIDYDAVHLRISDARKQSLATLKYELNLLT